MSKGTTPLLLTIIVSIVAVEAPLAQPKEGEPAPLPPDTTTVADSDTLFADTPPGFDPSGVEDRLHLTPRPTAKPDSIFGLSAFDEFLLPPVGPSLLFGREDLRLMGNSEWWEGLRHVPGLFVLEPGYPGVASAFSFHGHGPEGSRMVYDGRGLEGGISPIENVNAVGMGALAGVGVMRVGGSHLYGPGAGGGAVHYMPIVSAPDRPYTEVTHMTGIFGQGAGSITSSIRWGRGGVVFGYGGSRAGPWSLFDGYRAERYSLRADFVLPGVRFTAAGRSTDEKIKGIEPLVKRGDDGTEGHVGAEFRLGETAIGAVRLHRYESTVRADVFASHTFRELERSGALLLFRTRLAGGVRFGVMGGVDRDRLKRRGSASTLDERTETTGFTLLRAVWERGRWRFDVSGRYDRAFPRHDVWAAGGTVTTLLSPDVQLWGHLARTTDRGALLHRITDVEAQINQGVDLPVPEGTAPPTGITAAIGTTIDGGLLRIDVAAVAESGERRVGEDPDGIDDGYTVDEPTEVRLDDVETIGGWLGIETRPLHLGRVFGDIAFGLSGYLGSEPDVTGRQLEPWQYGEAHARLRKDLFDRNFRIEGEVTVRRLGPMPNRFFDLLAQSQWTGRAAIRVKDLLFFYRSERFLGTTYRTSGYDESIRFVDLTTRNVTFGLSWVLLD